MKTLERRFEAAMRSPTPEEAVYFSKLATLEYCGWIEENFDMIVRRLVKPKLKTPDYKNMLETRIIGNNFGFDYKKNFRPMLTSAVGIKNMETIEIYLKSSGQFEIFVSELESIKQHRDNAAHTWIDGPTKTYPSPSVILSKFNTLFPIVKQIYAEVRRL
ncbi:hypothetical protein FEF65_10750 [Mariprofundus erugo]|uniref:RiboL-PSP-HEPN domain-containing protein n=1 Tax=Mariprofundus erugo TaxID=2528639 RepID=A0A5R9GMG9_9PROT|nr:hypothetical protein [Mariprofundus erugo]TLS66285.1 hypothetical protein FEF65_10750 [Mariprofundus erugo]